MLFTESGSFGVIVDGFFLIPPLLQNRTWEFLLIRLLANEKISIKIEYEYLKIEFELE